LCSFEHPQYHKIDTVIISRIHSTESEPRHHQAAPSWTIRAWLLPISTLLTLLPW
jgi:hypothetical protein